MVENLGFAFCADAERPITLLADDAADRGTGIIGVQVQLPFAMLTSQTCDIAGERSAKYPFVQVSPVYDIAGHTTDGQDGLIRKDKVGELVRLDGPRFVGENHLWVADLRFEAPVEKALLLNREPLQGFADERGYLRASEKVASIRLRLAVDDLIERHILKPLRAAFKDGAIDHEPLIDILIRALPSTVHATSVRLYAIANETANVQMIQDAFDQWHVEQATKIPPALTFLGVTVRRSDDFTWSQAHGAAPIDFAYLSDESDEFE